MPLSSDRTFLLILSEGVARHGNALSLIREIRGVESVEEARDIQELRDRIVQLEQIIFNIKQALDETF
jgi:hypothetical protein